MQLSDIGDLFEICKTECNSRNPSVLVYMTLQHLNANWRNCEEFMDNVGCVTIKTADKWVHVFVDGDYEEFKRDSRSVTEGDNPKWIILNKDPCILICHNESTFKSGETYAKRWLMEKQSSFYSKDRGRFVMISDFLVQHPSGPLFNLNDNEWRQVVKEYPGLLKESRIQYVPRSSTGRIHVGVDGNFDNETVLQQFERLFQMLEFKTDYDKHDIIVLVDNARTHTVKEFRLNDLIYRLTPLVR
ncbi:unnamed protein product [Rotaria magnacalcarata]|nr:unnamed protein product [Rotaria magnacalcarata]CAF4001048.1 unnamed protein product [Rotaria magnacalcarata]